MPLDARQLRDQIVRPTLAYLNLPGGEVAERLVLGTAAQESGLRYLKQVGGGPALGLWQMEPFTFKDLWSRTRDRGDGLFRLISELAAPHPEPELQLISNLRLGAAMCRLHYYLRPFKMPERASVVELGKLWKENYNSYLGAGKVEEFVRNYERLMAPIY